MGKRDAYNSDVILSIIDNPNCTLKLMSEIFDCREEQSIHTKIEDLYQDKLKQLEETTFIDEYDIESFKKYDCKEGLKQLSFILEEQKISFKPLEINNEIEII